MHYILVTVLIACVRETENSLLQYLLQTSYTHTVVAETREQHVYGYNGCIGTFKEIEIFQLSFQYYITAVHSNDSRYLSTLRQQKHLVLGSGKFINTAL